MYNGFGRVDQASPNQLLGRTIGLSIPPPPPPAWNRLLTGSLGRDGGWLLPASAVSLVAGLAATRRRPRRDLLRVNFLLWGTWLVALAGSFSISSSINPYYVAALSPAIGGLLAGGFLLAWRGWHSLVVRAVTAATVLVTVAYGAWLLPTTGTGLPTWLEPLLLIVGVATALVLLIPFRPGAGPRLVVVGLGATLVSVLLAPTVASASMVTSRLGSFDTPFQPVAVTSGVRLFFGVTSTTAALLPTLEQARHGAPFLMATQTSALAAPFIFDSGQEVLPIGGFTGTIPSPTLSAIQTLVRQGRFHLVLQSPTTTDPRLVWIARHCISLPQPTGVVLSARFAILYCVPSSAAGRSNTGDQRVVP